MAKEHALLSTSQPNGNGCLVGVGKALTGSDRSPYSSPSGLAEAIVEGEPPVGVVALPDPVVHR
jgi:hypothetical protein